MGLDVLLDRTADASAAAKDCKHYERGCKLVTPCCGKVYACRFCHDEAESHQLDRRAVTELICASCDTRQPARSSCASCRLLFGRHVCLECNLYDYEERGQFHCAACGFCRVGGRERFYHCARCDMCMPVLLRDDHRCVEKASRANCPVCLEDMHTSRQPCHIPACGHLLHRRCFADLLGWGHYACPICQVSLPDMGDVWRAMDAEVAETPMPAEYRDAEVGVLCRDCRAKSRVRLHVVGLKCAACGSYNTCSGE